MVADVPDACGGSELACVAVRRPPTGGKTRVVCRFYSDGLETPIVRRGRGVAEDGSTVKVCRSVEVDSGRPERRGRTISSRDSDFVRVASIYACVTIAGKGERRVCRCAIADLNLIVNVDD